MSLAQTSRPPRHGAPPPDDFTWVAGADGSPAGWAVVLIPNLPPPVVALEIAFFPDFGDILTFEPHPAMVAVDMPIGLLDTPRPGGRPCDGEARRLLGPRAASVFSPPPRTCLGATSYDAVRDEGVTIQAFNVLPKIREVDRAMSPPVQARIREAHPELAFLRLTGSPMPESKHNAAGRAARLAALTLAFDERIGSLAMHFEQARGHFGRDAVEFEDLVDACALAITALNITRGEGRRLPEFALDPTRDSRGLGMEIWY